MICRNLAGNQTTFRQKLREFHWNSLFSYYEQTCFLSGSSHRNMRSIRFMIILGFSHRRSASWIRSSDTWDCSFSFISYFIDKTIKTLYHPLMFLTFTLNGG